MNINNEIFFYFYNLVGSSRFFDQLIIFFADIFPYLVIVGAFFYLLFHHEIFSKEKPIRAFIKKWKEFFFVFFSGLFAWILALGFKYLFHSPRPFDAFSNVFPLFQETGYAFPSGHATFFSALAFAIYYKHKKAGYFFISFAILIGLARIFSGVHFPVDILGGYILGFIIAFLLKKV